MHTNVMYVQQQITVTVISISYLFLILGEAINAWAYQIKTSQNQKSQQVQCQNIENYLHHYRTEQVYI